METGGCSAKDAVAATVPDWKRRRDTRPSVCTDSMRQGERVSHYIIPDGPFAHACSQLLAQGFRLNWQARPVAAEAKKSTRAKFTCAACGQNAWAKPDARLICGICYEENDELSPMEPS
jgi:hypothetical protein